MSDPIAPPPSSCGQPPEDGDNVDLAEHEPLIREVLHELEHLEIGPDLDDEEDLLP